MSEIFEKFPWASLGRRELPAEFALKLRDQGNRASLLSSAPAFSIVLVVPPGCNERWLAESKASVEEQSYPHRELVVETVAEGETEADAKARGLARAGGDWVGFLRGGDVLSPAALFEFATELQKAPQTDVLFTNEVTVDGASRELSRFLCKSEFSRFNLWHFNAVGSLWMAKRALLQQVGGLSTAAAPFEEHDLLLRLAETTSHVRHVPFYFYHRREGSPAAPAPTEAWVERVRASAKRSSFTADIQLRDGRVKAIPKTPKAKTRITAVICFRDRAAWTIRAARALAGQVGDSGKVALDLILVDNDSQPAEYAEVQSFLSTLPVPAKLVTHRGPFNFAHMHNTVIREHAKGDLLLLLNNDVFLEGEPMLEEWAAWAWQPDVGTVGIQLRFSHGPVQHSGIGVRFGGEARLVRVGHPAGDTAYVGESREVFANTFAACLMKRSVYDAIGGLRELDLANGFGDVAFNLECVRKGWHNLYLGHLQGVHLESASRGMAYEYWEECAVEREYPELLQKMLRHDYGYDRVPGADYSIPHFLGQALKVKFREHSDWLNPLKPALKKVLWTWQQRGHNRA